MDMRIELMSEEEREEIIRYGIKRGKISFTAIMLMVVMLMSSMPVFAGEIDGDMDLSEGGKAFVETAENYGIAKLNTDKMLSNKTLRIAYKVLDVTCFKQENGYYCGPTTVKQVLHYLNGSSLTKSQYATKLGTTNNGTDVTVISGVVNKLTSKHSYAYSAISDINTQKNSAWPYSTAGHFINTSGYNYQAPVQQVRITDPYEKGIGNKWYTVDVLYDVNNAHFRHAMIW